MKNKIEPKPVGRAEIDCAQRSPKGDLRGSEGHQLIPIPALLADYAKWIRLQGFSKDSPKDHRDKLSRFFAFARSNGAVDAAQRIDFDLIDTEMIADYQAHLFEVVSEKTGKRLATATQINLLAYLEAFYRFLKATYRIVVDPTEIIKLPRHSKPLPASLLTPEEVRRLLALPDLHTPTGFRDRVILEVFWTTGMRLGELVALHVDDVRFAENLLTLRSPKGRKDRSVPVGTGALAWLRTYIDEVRPLLVKEAGTRGGGADWLFLSRFGLPMHKTSVYYKMKAYRHRARIKKPLGTHTFRHTLASEMLKGGADLRHIQEMLGHDNLTTTQRYLHIVKAELKKVHGRTHPREAAETLPPHYRGSRS